MKTIQDIFGENAHDFDQNSYFDALENVLVGADRSVLEEAIQNINGTPNLGEGYAEDHPELLAGVVQAIINDHNTRHLVHTMQVTCAVMVDTLEKNQTSILAEIRELREAITASKEAGK